MKSLHRLKLSDSDLSTGYSYDQLAPGLKKGPLQNGTLWGNPFDRGKGGIRSHPLPLKSIGNLSNGDGNENVTSKYKFVL